MPVPVTGESEVTCLDDLVRMLFGPSKEAFVKGEVGERASTGSEETGEDWGSADCCQRRWSEYASFDVDYSVTEMDLS
jgi:hypothetical protein